MTDKYTLKLNKGESYSNKKKDLQRIMIIMVKYVLAVNESLLFG